MKTCLTNLLCCMAACLALSLISCGDDDDWGRYNGGYNNGYNSDYETPVNGFAGQWKGSLQVKCHVFSTTFLADEVYVKIDVNEKNNTIGTGELLCFYDNERCPVVAESIFFTWYVRDSEIVIDVPCDANLCCTVANWSVSGDMLTGVIKGEGFSSVLELRSLNGYNEWGKYSEETKYAVFYRNQAISGEWTGDLNFSCKEGDTEYKATACIRFQPKDEKGLRGVGEEIEYYEKPCTIHYESLYFTWEMVDGVLELTYPYDESMNMDIYQILLTADTFEALFNADGEFHLTKLVDYKDWGLYDKTTGYAIAYYEVEAPEAVRRMMSARTLRGQRLNERSRVDYPQRRTVSIQ
ncbi:MAG: hypothetical protein Q4E32_00745 [Bacteroidales bacterium]|nr:hypothetical protein [Bacteroidales bacterium]